MANALKTISNVITGTLDVPTAEARAVQSRQLTIDAGAAVESAKAQLMAADDAQDAGAIQAAEARLIAVNRDADRATRALSIAEDRLRKAQDAAATAAKTEGVKALRLAVAQHRTASQTVQQAIESVIAAVAEIDSADVTITALQRQGIGSRNAVAAYNYGPAVTRSRIKMALDHAKVLTGFAPHELEPMTDWSSKLGVLLLSE